VSRRDGDGPEADEVATPAGGAGGGAHVVVITGAPGAGKSTLTGRLLACWPPSATTPDRRDDTTVLLLAPGWGEAVQPNKAGATLARSRAARSRGDRGRR